MTTDGVNSGFLGDTPQRAYGNKLELFNRFAAPELRALIAGLGLQPGQRALDAGCGTGLMTGWLGEQVSPGGLALGFDLATRHVYFAQEQAAQSGVAYLQADMVAPPLAAGAFDLVWVSNAINHLRRPVDGVRRLAGLLRPGGRLALGQSAFLPEMLFAWDARLEGAVVLACRQYYRDKYGLDERDTTAVRNLFGWLKEAGLQGVTARTIVIERTAPLSPVEETYFVEAFFRGYWGPKVRPYLEPDDWAELEALCDPTSPRFCLRRPDFHHLQTYTVVVGGVS